MTIYPRHRARRAYARYCAHHSTLAHLAESGGWWHILHAILHPFGL